MNRKQQDLTREFERVAPLPDIYRGWRDQLQFYRMLADRMPDQRRTVETAEGWESGPRDIIDYAIRDAENAAEAGDLDGFALHLQQAVEVLIHSDFGTVGELFRKKQSAAGGENKRGHEGPLKKLLRTIIDEIRTDDADAVLSRWREAPSYSIGNAETVYLSHIGDDDDNKCYWAEWQEAETMKAWSERAIKDALREIRR